MASGILLADPAMCWAENMKLWWAAAIKSKCRRCMTSGALEVRGFRMNTRFIITMKKNHLFEPGGAPDMSRNDYREELFVLD